MISVSHYSPYVAKRWLDYIFVMLNEVVKEIKLTVAKKSYEFLQNELSMTKEVDLKSNIHTYSKGIGNNYIIRIIRIFCIFSN